MTGKEVRKMERSIASMTTDEYNRWNKTYAEYEKKREKMFPWIAGGIVMLVLFIGVLSWAI